MSRIASNSARRIRFLLLSLACACKIAPDRSQACDQRQAQLIMLIAAGRGTG